LALPLAGTKTVKSGMDTFLTSTIPSALVSLDSLFFTSIVELGTSLAYKGITFCAIPEKVIIVKNKIGSIVFGIMVNRLAKEKQNN
jgi:hypothetical protein